MTDGAGAGSGHPTEEDRDRYMRLLDNAHDRGLLDAEEHAHRVVAVGAAGSIEELNDIVWQLPVMERPAVARPAHAPARRQGRGPGRASFPLPDRALPSLPAIEPVLPDSPAPGHRSAVPDLADLSRADPDGVRRLDPVDIAMLQMRRNAKKPEPARRWLALVVVVIMFLVLIVLGVVLAAHSRASNGGNSGANQTSAVVFGRPPGCI